ncbi:hypothetical protein NFI96_007185 [Prochilodus magdalenae]|nr:hypothetical protein NFI96_007185 [Prochilodus magdalenae]
MNSSRWLFNWTNSSAELSRLLAALPPLAPGSWLACGPWELYHALSPEPPVTACRRNLCRSTPRISFQRRGADDDDDKRGSACTVARRVIFFGTAAHVRKGTCRRLRPKAERTAPAVVSSPTLRMVAKSMQIPITLSYQGLSLTFAARIDSGAEGNFIPTRVAIPVVTLNHSLRLSAMDGDPVGKGVVSFMTPSVTMAVSALHSEEIHFCPGLLGVCSDFGTSVVEDAQPCCFLGGPRTRCDPPYFTCWATAAVASTKPPVVAHSS